MSKLESAGLPAAKEPNKRVPGEKKGAIPEPVKGSFTYKRIEDIPINLREHIAENVKSYQSIIESIRNGEKKIFSGSDDDLEIKQIEREARLGIARLLGALDLDTADLQAELISRIWNGEAALPDDPHGELSSEDGPPIVASVPEDLREIISNIVYSHRDALEDLKVRLNGKLLQDKSNRQEYEVRGEISALLSTVLDADVDPRDSIVDGFLSGESLLPRKEERTKRKLKPTKISERGTEVKRLSASELALTPDEMKAIESLIKTYRDQRDHLMADRAKRGRHGEMPLVEMREHRKLELDIVKRIMDIVRRHHPEEKYLPALILKEMVGTKPAEAADIAAQAVREPQRAEAPPQNPSPLPEAPGGAPKEEKDPFVGRYVNIEGRQQESPKRVLESIVSKGGEIRYKVEGIMHRDKGEDKKKSEYLLLPADQLTVVPEDQMSFEGPKFEIGQMVVAGGSEAFTEARRVTGYGRNKLEPYRYSVVDKDGNVSSVNGKFLKLAPSAETSPSQESFISSERPKEEPRGPSKDASPGSPEGKRPATSFERDLWDLEKKRDSQLKEARHRFAESSHKYADAGESWKRAFRQMREEFSQKLEELKKKYGMIEGEQAAGGKYKKGDRINFLNLEGEPLFDESQPVSEVKEEGGRYMYKVEGSDFWYPEDVVESEKSSVASPATEAAAEAVAAAPEPEPSAAPAVESEPAKPFSAAEAANTPAFLKFLRDYAPGVQSEAGEPGVIEKWFKRYELKNRCVDQMTEFWLEISLSEKFKDGVKKDEVRTTLEVRLSTMAAENPSALARLSERLEYLKEASGRIEERKREVLMRTAELDGLPESVSLQKRQQKAQETKALARQRPLGAFARTFWKGLVIGLKERKGVFAIGTAAKEALAAAREVGAAQQAARLNSFKKMSAQLESEATQIETAIESREQAENIKKMIHARRLAITRRFFEDFPELKTSFEQAKKMAQTHLAELMILSKTSEGRDLQKDGGTLQQAQKYFEELSQRTDADFLEGFTLNGKAMNRKKIQEEINFLIAGTVQTQFDREIESLTINLDNEKRGAVDQLADAIKNYLEKGELGSKKGEQVRKFFQNIIRRKIEELQRDGSDPAKCIALQVLLSDVLKAEVKAPVPNLGKHEEHLENVGGFKMGDLVRLPGQPADDPATWKFVGPMKGAEGTVRLESLERGLGDGQGFSTEMTILLEDLQRANGKKISRPAAAPQKPESPAQAADTVPQPKAKASLDEIPRVDSVKGREPEQDHASILGSPKENPARAIPHSSERIVDYASVLLEKRTFKPREMVRVRAEDENMVDGWTFERKNPENTAEVILINRLPENGEYARRTISLRELEKLNPKSKSKIKSKVVPPEGQG